MREVWKQIPGFHNYAVSSLGRIRRETEGKGTYPGKLLMTDIGRWGYKYVKLYSRGQRTSVYLHKAVLWAFKGKQKLEGNHKNGKKEDNRLTNLEYVTRSQNILHSYKIGTHRKGPKHPCARLCLFEVKQIRKLRGKLLQREIAEQFKISRRTVSGIQLGRTWKESFNVTALEEASEEGRRGNI